MKIKKTLILLPLILGSCSALASCNGTSSSSSDNASTSETPVEGSIKVTSSVTTVSVGNSITIRVVVTGTAKRDVVWSSSNESVATVNGGIVTGVSEGTAKITITLAADDRVSTSVDITVTPSSKPTKITIEGDETGQGWVGEDVSLSVSVYPEDADPRIVYVSSDESVATVDENGVINFLTAGTVKITAKSAADETISASKTFTVKKGVFFTNKGGYSNNFDYSHQGDSDSYIETNLNLIPGDNQPAIAWFNTKASTKYYAVATFNITKEGDDGWVRVGVGSGTNDNDTRGFYFSPKEGQKTCVLDLPNNWGAAAGRTFIWQVNGIKNLDKTNIAIGVLRDGNEYYYTINGKLYWYEQNTRFNDLPTLPAVVSKDASFKVSNASVTTDETTLNNMIKSADFQKKFFNSGSSDGQVTYVSDTEFKFNNIYTNEENSRFRDQCVKSYGDRGRIGNNFTIEFDVEGYTNYPSDVNSMLGIALRRYDSNDPIICDSVMVDDNSFQFRTWNYDSQYSYGTMNNALFNTETFSSSTKDLSNVHVKIVRTLESTSSTFKVYLNGTEYKFVDASGKEMELTINYVGKYLIMVGANNAKGTVKNFTFSENE